MQAVADGTSVAISERPDLQAKGTSDNEEDGDGFQKEWLRKDNNLPEAKIKKLVRDRWDALQDKLDKLQDPKKPNFWPNIFQDVCIARDGGMTEVDRLFTNSRFGMAFLAYSFIVLNLVTLLAPNVTILMEDVFSHRDMDALTSGNPPFLITNAIIKAIFGVELKPEVVLAFMELLLVAKLTAQISNCVYTACYGESFERWHAIAHLFFDLLRDLQVLSALKMLSYVAPSIFIPAVLGVYQEFTKNKKYGETLTFILTRVFAAIIGFDAFVVKFRVAANAAAQEDGLLVVLANLSFLNQMLGVVQVGREMQQRLLKFIFAGEDATMQTREYILQGVWKAMLLEEVWRRSARKQNRVAWFVSIAITFGDYDFQTLALNDVRKDQHKVETKLGHDPGKHVVEAPQLLKSPPASPDKELIPVLPGAQPSPPPSPVLGTRLRVPDVAAKGANQVAPAKPEGPNATVIDVLPRFAPPSQSVALMVPVAWLGALAEASTVVPQSTLQPPPVEPSKSREVAVVGAAVGSLEASQKSLQRVDSSMSHTGEGRRSSPPKSSRRVPRDAASASQSHEGRLEPPAGGAVERLLSAHGATKDRRSAVRLISEDSILGNSFALFPEMLSLEAPAAPGVVRKFTNAAAAFQALKYWSLAERFASASAEEARSLVDGRMDGDYTYAGFVDKWQGMLAVLRAKFSPGSPSAAALLATGEAFLLYAVDGGAHQACADKLWSNAGDGSGLNWLGLQLMLIRDELSGRDDWTALLASLVDLGTGGARTIMHARRWQDAVIAATEHSVEADAPREGDPSDSGGSGGSGDSVSQKQPASPEHPARRRGGGGGRRRSSGRPGQAEAAAPSTPATPLAAQGPEAAGSDGALASPVAAVGSIRTP